MNTEPTNVLIIEDDADIALMIKIVLTNEGFNAVVCSTHLNFPPLPGDIKPGLIIIDMLLSGKDGRSICQKLKHEDATKIVPVLMISAHSDVELSCRVAGADDFLLKPFEIQDLVTKVKRLMMPR